MIKVESFYDQATGTYTHLIIDLMSAECIVIDPVLNFDNVSSHISDSPIKPVIEKIISDNLSLLWILETHAHADHLSAAKQLQASCGGKIAISERIKSIQVEFKKRYCFGDEFVTDGNQFDRLLKDDDRLMLGSEELRVIATPGHTPDSCSFVIADNIFIGDTLFHPTIGTARCDFPGGDAMQLFRSIELLLSYDDSNKLYLCHDYPDDKREEVPYVTVKEMRENVHLIASENMQEAYTELRISRDKELALPKLIIPAIQVNICAGITIDENNENCQHLKWPINVF
jgi:glyoxylase-like metal-dependent hydrolase (beta-lactamase superfamily II)